MLDMHINIRYGQHHALAASPFKRAGAPKHNSTVNRVKSFVDDLDKERGVVSMRVAIVLRSAEIQPYVPLICAIYIVHSPFSSTPPPPPPPTTSYS